MFYCVFVNSDVLSKLLRSYTSICFAYRASNIVRSCSLDCLSFFIFFPGLFLLHCFFFTLLEDLLIYSFYSCYSSFCPFLSLIYFRHLLCGLFLNLADSLLLIELYFNNSRFDILSCKLSEFSLEPFLFSFQHLDQVSLSNLLAFEEPLFSFELSVILLHFPHNLLVIFTFILGIFEPHSEFFLAFFVLQNLSLKNFNLHNLLCVLLSQVVDVFLHVLLYPLRLLENLSLHELQNPIRDEVLLFKRGAVRK